MVDYPNVGIRVEEGENSYRDIHFKSKKECKEIQYIQNQLSKYHSNKEENFEKVTCLCTPITVAKILLSVKHSKATDKYYLSNFPNNPPHQMHCPFYQDKDGKSLVDEDGKYSNEIFKEEQNLYKKGVDLRERKKIEERDQQRKHTFNNFCRDLISETIIYSFNKINQKSNSLKNPTSIDFFSTFWSLLFKESSFFKKGSILDITEEGYSFEFGIVEKKPIDLEKGKNRYFLKVKKSKGKNDFLNRTYSFSKEKYERLLKSITNYKNIIPPPYFYIAIVKPNRSNDKIYNNIVRFYMHPISYSKKGLIFIESDLERRYAESLLTQNIPTIKPFMGNEVYRIKKGIFTYEQNGKNRVFNLNGYRPDFIEFRNDIHIVEIAGYQDENYIKELTRKVEYFEKEAKRHHYRYRIDIVRE